ncbi:MAG TPA: polysaccharide biosynthesis/export family protein [Alphaproteobacteria bacterium]|nr:polysaccharide biosynthesis/export family protein [Alphaproteobacteria bacterium]
MTRTVRALLAGLALALAGCAQNALVPLEPTGLPRSAMLPPAGGAPTAAPPVRTDYVLAVGDELELKFFFNPELNERVTIRPDGRISLQLVDDVPAEGLTASALAARLEAAYAAEVRQPNVAVIVRSFANQRVFVGGEVRRPGAQPLAGRLTLLQALLAAEGPTEAAGSDKVVVTRRGPGGQPQVLTVNARRLLDGADPAADIELQPLDVVTVPRAAFFP